MADHEEQCNCDQALELCKLLAQARDIIAEHVSLSNRSEWLEDLHRSWAFKDPEEPQ